MIDFSDAPYRWFPPRYNPPVAWAVKRINRRWYLPRTKRIAGVEVGGLERLNAARRPGDRLILLPNHPTHADAYIFVEFLRQAGLRSQIMSAYDVFLRGRIGAFVMQSLGCFSVDREGSDARAMKQAMTTIRAGNCALTIFPEGNVYLENDIVTPFNEGAAFLALKASQALSEEKAEGRVLAVPVSIKVSHATDVRPRLVEAMRKLALSLGVGLPLASPPQAWLKTIGVAALRRNLKHRGYAFAGDESMPVKDLVAAAAGDVLATLEAKLDLAARPEETAIERVRRVRRAIHEVRTDPERAVDHRAAQVWADEAMIAFRIASYSGSYVASKPTVDRVAETVEKLQEDLFDKHPPPFADRHAIVEVGEPIDVGPYLVETKLRAAVRKLTDDVEDAVQCGLNAINSRNTLPGAQLWTEPID